MPGLLSVLAGVLLGGLLIEVPGILALKLLIRAPRGQTASAYLFLSTTLGMITIGLGGILLGSLGQFWLVWLLLGAAALCLGMYLLGRRLDQRFVLPSFSRWDGLAWGLLLLMALTFGNPHENVIVGRDPGVYTNAAIHLARTGQWAIEDSFYAALPDVTRRSLDLRDSPLLMQMRASSPSVRLFGFFWLERQQEAVSQFLPFYSVWAALLEQLLGPMGGQWAALFFTLLGALGIYSLAASFWHPRAGIMALLLLLANPATLWHARSANAEMALQVLCLFLIALWHRGRDEFHAWGGEILFAGALGAALLDKLDTLYLLPPLLLVYGLAWLARGKSRYYGRTALLTLGMGGLAALFMMRFSGPYLIMTFGRLGEDSAFRGLLALVALLILIILVLAILLRGLLRRILAACRAWILGFQGISGRQARLLALALALAFGLAYVLLPLTVSDPTEADKRLSLIRLSWYVTPMAWWLAGIGLLHLFSRRPSRGQILLAALLASSTLLGLVGTRLDHIWTIRRYMPIVIPVLLLLSGGGLEALIRWRPRQMPYLGWSLALVLGLGMFVGQGIRTWGLLPHREFAGAREFLDRLALRFPKNAVILIDPASPWGGESILASFMGPYLWLAHDLEPLYMARPLTPEDWQAVQATAQQQERGLFVIGESNAPIMPDSGSVALERLSWDIPALEHTIDRFPARVEAFHFEFTIWEPLSDFQGWRFNPEALLSQVGEIRSLEGTSILQSDGTPGFLSYGPYQRFPEGRYLARFRLQNADVRPVEIQLDVIPVNHAPLVQSTFALPIEDTWAVVDLPFEIDSQGAVSDTPLEMRVLSPEGGLVRLLSLEVIPLAGAKMPLRGPRPVGS